MYSHVTQCCNHTGLKVSGVPSPCIIFIHVAERAIRADCHRALVGGLEHRRFFSLAVASPTNRS